MSYLYECFFDFATGKPSKGGMKIKAKKGSIDLTAEKLISPEELAGMKDSKDISLTIKKELVASGKVKPYIIYLTITDIKLKV
jgi:hypothetical protein